MKQLDIGDAAHLQARQPRDKGVSGLGQQPGHCQRFDELGHLTADPIGISMELTGKGVSQLSHRHRAIKAIPHDGTSARQTEIRIIPGTHEHPLAIHLGFNCARVPNRHAVEIHVTTSSPDRRWPATSTTNAPLAESRRSSRPAIPVRTASMLPAVEGMRTTPFDLDVSFGEVPSSLGPDFNLAPGKVAGDRSRAMVHFPGAWSLLVEQGQSATVTQTGANPLPSWVVDGWAIPIAALQRGYLCLHATVVEIAGTVLAIAGESGAGKSTTAASLTQRGHHLIVDDTTVVDLTPTGPVVLPFRRSVHLTDDATAALGIPNDKLTRDPASNKHLWHPGGQSAAPGPLPLGAIVLLDPTGNGTVDVEALTGAEKLAQVANHAGRRETSSHLLGPRTYFSSLATLCAAVPVWLVRRAPQARTLDTVTDAIEALAATASR